MLETLEHPAAHLCRKLGLSEELTLLGRAWEAEAGGLAAMARIVALEQETLVVEVDSSTAHQELSLRRRELVRRINRHFSAPFLKRISLRMAREGV
jgi:hypothetical protein